MPWYKKLHWQIIIGLVLGLVYGIVAASAGWGDVTEEFISPFGTIFLRLLQLIAVPLVLASLITGVASLSNLQKLSRIGGKTIGIYLATTFVALVIGLVLVNVMQPGKTVPPDVRDRLEESYSDDAAVRQQQAEATRERGRLQILVDMVPDNFFNSASSNRNMLQIVFFSVFVGIGLIMIPKEKAKPLLDVFDSLNDLIIKLVDVIMYMAPVGVFALLAGTITSIAGGGGVIELLTALGYYCIAVLVGLILQTCVTYPMLLKFFTPINIMAFFRGIAPAQLVAFSTSSSGATLPVTMEMAEKNIGVSEEVSSFVLPLGATINMDGTGLYQAIAAVFIAQTVGMDLGLGAQLTIVFTALLASIGTAAVPGAGIIMLVIILESVGVPNAGIALILGVDRILDTPDTHLDGNGSAQSISPQYLQYAALASCPSRMHE